MDFSDSAVLRMLRILFSHSKIFEICFAERTNDFRSKDRLVLQFGRPRVVY